MACVAAALATSACSQSVYVSPPGHTATPTPAPQPSSGQTASPTASPAAGVTPSPAASPSATPVASMVPVSPAPSATPSGTLYVADDGDGSILAFPAGGSGNIAPSFALSSGNGAGGTFGGMTFDANGVLYVSNNDGSDSSIAYFQPPISSSSMARGFTYSNLYAPADIAVDPSGYIYVLDPEAQRTGQSGPVAASIFVFAPGTTGAATPVRTISGTSTLVTKNTLSLAVDATTIYVADIAKGEVDEFPLSANGNVAPSATLGGSTTGIDYPTSVRVDALDRLVVKSANNGTVTILRFSPGATGNTPPSSSIDVSSFEHGEGAAGECLDAQSNLYLPHLDESNDTSPAAGFFPVADSGAATPSLIISGSNTKLSQPQFCAVH